MQQAGKNGGTLHSWERGQSGNPKGRPRGGFLSRLFDEFAQQFNEADEIVINLNMTDSQGHERHHTLRLSEDGRDAIAIPYVAIRLMVKAVEGDIGAIKLLLNYSEGRAPKTIDLFNDAIPITLISTCVDGSILIEEVFESDD